MGDRVTYAEAAEILGVTKNTVYRWVRDRKIPFLNINGVKRLFRSQIEQFKAEHTNVPNLTGDPQDPSGSQRR